MAQGVYVSFCLYTYSFLAILKALQQTQGRRVVNGLELSAMVYFVLWNRNAIFLPATWATPSKRVKDSIVDVFPVVTVVLIVAGSAARQIREF
jgi:RsiW-degrading membrane proteinase PrsW (M82 family)